MSNYSSNFYKEHSANRFSYRKIYGYIAIILVILMMSWEFQKVDAAIVGQMIPEESIRLRILANSDSANDQLIKAVVRDEVVAAMNNWITEPLTIEQARQVVQDHMPELELVIAETLLSNGYEYSYAAELEVVDFPTKMYGQLVYAAGQYEALLITLGEGKGRNWWCVLFPPLCFVDAVSGEAAPKSASPAPTEDAESAFHASEVSEGPDELIVQEQASEQEQEQVEVKFFIVELIDSIGAWFSALFA